MVAQASGAARTKTLDPVPAARVSFRYRLVGSVSKHGHFSGDRSVHLRKLALVLMPLLCLPEVALAQRQCDGILPYLRETEFVRNSEYAQEVLAARITQMSYSEFRRNFEAGATIPVKGIPVSGNMSESQFNSMRQSFSQSVDVNRVRSNEAVLLRVRPNQAAVNAWASCVARDRGLSVFVEPRQSSNEFIVNIRYDRFPGGAQAIRLAGLSFGPGVSIVDRNSEVMRFLPNPYTTGTQDSLTDGSDIAFIIRRERSDQPIDILVNGRLPDNTVISDRVSIPVIQRARVPRLVSVGISNAPIGSVGAGANVLQARDFTIGSIGVSGAILMNPRNAHPNPEIRFDVAGRFESFNAIFGLYSAGHPDCQYGPSVVFTILRDGEPWQWPNGARERRFQGATYDRIRVPLSGVQNLTIKAVWGHGREHCADGAFGEIGFQRYE